MACDVVGCDENDWMEKVTGDSGCTGDRRDISAEPVEEY